VHVYCKTDLKGSAGGPVATIARSNLELVWNRSIGTVGSSLPGSVGVTVTHSSLLTD
jgi:hypothetical protein